MDCVEVGKVTHENVCAINTCLVMLAFSKRSGRLGPLLAALRRRVRPPGDPRPPVCVCFRELLESWKTHYTGTSVGMGRDQAALVFSTGVKFEAWKETVDTLCGPEDSPTALLYAEGTGE